MAGSRTSTHIKSLPENMEQTKKSIIIMVPYPAQGHVSPMKKLASVFVSHGFEAVIVLPQHVHRKIRHNDGDDDDEKDDEIKWIGLADGQEEETAPDFFAIESVMENCMPKQLEELLEREREREKDNVVCCLVVDLLASWAIQVADKFGIPSAGFWPAMLASYLLIAAIPDMLRSGLISDTGIPQDAQKITILPELPVLSTEDLPWLIGTVAARKARFKFWIRTLERSRTLKWLLVNSFPEESINEVQKCSSQSQSVLAIGPICNIGRPYLRLSSFWEEDLSCLKWLARQEANSVVYVSFGSWVSPIGESNLKSLALALESLGRPFIWVLRSTWRQGLPIGFMDRILEHDIGKIVSWAPQLDILQHKSVGCFITHCGWNSTLEALQFRKKLLCYPVAGDQFVNCTYIVDVWRVGLRLNGLGQKDVEEGIARVLEDIEMDTRLMKLYERIMGMQGDNKRGAFLLKTFVEHFKKPSTIHQNACFLAT